MSAMEEAIQEFTSESEEMLERISLSLSSLEKEGPDKEVLSSIYRDMHTIKGSSQLFGFNQIGILAHALESSLDPLRQGIIPLNLNLVDIIYTGCDVISKLVKSIKETQAEIDVEIDLKQIIPQLIEITVSSLGDSSRYLRDDFVSYDLQLSESFKDSPAASPSTNPEASEIKVEAKAPEPKLEGKDAAPKIEAKASEPKIEVKAPEPKIEVKAPEPKIEAKAPEPKIEAKAPEPKIEAKAPEPKTNNAPIPVLKNMGNRPAAKQETSQETIRVQVALLDKLMNLAGELVLVRNQVLRFASNQRDNEFSKISQRVNIVTTEIQNEVMKTRMQPVGSILSKFHRVIRDLSKELNKKIELKLEGTETELDKTLIEAVKDPLTHIVRNSADHGLETPEERKAAGKSELGTVTIRSYHEGGQVVIEISDNGRGLSREKIGGKAVEKSIISQNQLELMSDKEVYQLIFAPGFSTAAAVSNISGRGVGMDVVRTNIEKIGGIIDLNAIPGEGTTILLKIPLTLAIVPALLIKEGESNFAIPQVKLLELLRINQSDDNKEHQIEILQGKPVYRLRGQLLPLVSLARITGLKEDDCPREGSCNIVVLKAGNSVFGLIVDSIEDSADIVVKPLTTFLKALGIYAGATLLGDGNVALTLDVMGIADKAMINSGEDEADFSVAKESNVKDSAITDYLVVDVGDQSRYCFPLPMVNRLEEFKNSDYDYSGSQKVVRYRGSLLPIISAPDFLGIPPVDKEISADSDPIVVIKRNNRLFGVQVREISDVISSTSKIDDQINSSQGIMGNIIHGDEVLVIIDAPRMIDQHCFNNNIKIKDKEESSGDNLILVVEDSKFFRNHIKGMLENNGYNVITAENGEDALDQLSSHWQKVDLVVSDIEMPKMDGYTLAKHISDSEDLSKIPMVAVTTRFRQADIDRGMSVGFQKYLEKLNEEQLLSTITELVSEAA